MNNHEASLNPGYCHRNHENQVPPATNVTHDEAAALYLKLREFLAVDREAIAPGVDPSKQRPVRVLFYIPRVFYRAFTFYRRVQWNPKLLVEKPEQFRQLTFTEFLVWYGIRLY